MTPPKTITQIQLEHGLCNCEEIYTSRGLTAPDCPMHSSAVEEAMEAWGEIRGIEFAEWIFERHWRKHPDEDNLWYLPSDDINIQPEEKSSNELYAIFLQDAKNKP